MTKRFVFAGLMSGIFSLVLLCGGFAQAETIKWQYSITPGPVKSVMELYEEFQNKARIEAPVKIATGHDFEITVHKGLVAPSDNLDAVRDGRVDMAQQGVMYRADLTILNALALPIIIPYEKCRELEEQLLPVFEDVLNKQYDVVMLGMGYWPRQMLLSKAPAGTFAELKGTKFRCHSYELLQLTKRAGGSPVTMPYGEAYLALQKGAIQGAASSLSGMAGGKWFEVAKHVNWWPFGNAVYFNIANKKAFAKLPEGVQRAMKEVYRNSGRETWLMSDLEDQKAKAEYTQKYGLQNHYPPQADIEQFKKMVGPVVDEWKKRAGARGPEVMGIINKVMGTKY